MSNWPTTSLLPQTNIQFYSWVYALGYSSDDLAYFHRVYDLSQKLFGCKFRASGKPFIAHLVGTAAALSLEKPPPWVIGYALCHLAVDNGQYRFGRSLAAKREQFASVVGPEAIALDEAYRITQSCPEDQLAAVFSGEVTPSSCQWYALMVWLANELEDYLDNGLRFSGKRACPVNQEASLLEVARKCGWKRLEQLGLDIFSQLDESSWIEPLSSERSSAYTSNELTGFFPLTTRIRWKLKRLGRQLGLSCF